MRKLICLTALCLFTATVAAETVVVSLEKDNAIAILDAQEGKLNKTVPVGQRPRGIALSD